MAASQPRRATWRPMRSEPRPHRWWQVGRLRAAVTGLALVVAFPALADPLDALAPTARAIYARAEEQETSGRFATSASLYQLVLDQDPTFVPARLGLGRALEAQGKLGDAEALYRDALGDPDVSEALATLLESSRPAEALEEWVRLEPARVGDPTPYLHETRLRVKLGMVDDAQVSWERYLALLQGAMPDGAVFLDLVDAAPAAAEGLLRAYLESWPEGSAAAEAHERLERIEVEAEAARLDLGGDTPLDAELLAVAARVEAALAQGDVSTAKAVGAELVTRAPDSSTAHARYADALIAAGSWGEAEVQARIARRLAPEDASARARLGRLLADAYGGRRDTEALTELQAACQLRSGDAGLRFRLAIVQQRTGHFSDAEASYRAVLAADAGGQWAPEAQSRLDALIRTPPVLPEPSPSARMEMSAAAEHHYRVFLVLLGRGKREEAAVELDQAVTEEPHNALLLRKHGDLDNEAGHPDAAVIWWRRSLDADPAQPDIWRNLAGAAKSPEERKDCLARAAELGDPEAHYQLARLAREIGDWATVEAELGAYERSASLTSEYRLAAGAMRSELQARRRAFALLWLFLGLVGLGTPALWWWRRRTSRTLSELLEATPESWHEAARLLAGIRHEVLKHNTTVLPQVAEAAERGDLAPWNALVARLPELTEKLHAYVGALVTLGRARHVRFVPAVDPTFGPLLRAFARLRRMRRPDPEALREISRVVNEDAYGTIGRLVREICVLRCDEALVREVYARVSAEPGFAGTALPELWVTGGPLTLRLFRPDLEDILANLLRNALSAGATALAVALSDTEDEVTGHPLAEIAVIDDAPGALSNAMIRSRFIGRGLGLAVDLTNRHGGSIRVDARAEGAKAVVVQFQLAEAGAD